MFQSNRQVRVGAMSDNMMCDIIAQFLWDEVVVHLAEAWDSMKASWTCHYQNIFRGGKCLWPSHFLLLGSSRPPTLEPLRECSFSSQGSAVVGCR